jgi:hypothetical protein
MDRKEKIEWLDETLSEITDWLDGIAIVSFAEYAEEDARYAWASKIEVRANGEVWETYAQTLETPAEHDCRWDADIYVGETLITNVAGVYEDVDVAGEELWGKVLEALGV